jgi:hypothetical protein
MRRSPFYGVHEPGEMMALPRSSSRHYKKWRLNIHAASFRTKTDSTHLRYARRAIMVFATDVQLNSGMLMTLGAAAGEDGPAVSPLASLRTLATGGGSILN